MLNEYLKYDQLLNKDEMNICLTVIVHLRHRSTFFKKFHYDLNRHLARYS